MRLGFPDEHFTPPPAGTGSVFYRCKPYPGVRIAVWGQPVEGESCAINIYTDPPSNNTLTDQSDRAIPSHGPMRVTCDPLELQMAILYLVQLYQQTLPTEVTENEEA